MARSADGDVTPPGLLLEVRVQVEETSLWSKDVQRLLWAAGEARERVRRPERTAPGAAQPAAPDADAGFVTEWQATG